MATDYVTEPAAAKIEIVGELRELIGSTSAAILTDYRGLSVAQLTDLRKKLRGVDAEFRVVKNTLFKLAGEGLLPISELDEQLAGPTAIGFAKGDPIAATKVIVDFVKDHSKIISIKGGVVEGRVVDVATVDALSKIPSREVLISQMLGSMQSPIAGLVGTLNGIISNLVYTLQAVVEKQSAPAETAEAAA